MLLATRWAKIRYGRQNGLKFFLREISYQAIIFVLHKQIDISIHFWVTHSLTKDRKSESMLTEYEDVNDLDILG